MAAKDKRGSVWHSLSAAFETVRRSFSEFLFVPSCVIAAFLLLALASYLLDTSQIDSGGPVRDFLRSRIFSNADATQSLLSAIAAGVITMTSITISLLLIAVQQSAGSMTAEVFDQFLRRRANQIYFGFFIGLTLFALITLATVNEPFNPVFGATIAFLATAASLYLLIVLLYTTINQMRPIEIIEAIHEHILAARERQLASIGKTLRVSEFQGSVTVPVKTERHGFISRVDFDSLARTATNRGEVILKVSIGAYVAFRDEIAEVKAHSVDDASEISKAVLGAVRIERQRDMALDPAYGIHQLEMIAWTSISTSKSNPSPGLLTIMCLRDVMSRWSEQNGLQPAGDRIPIVYSDDTVAKLFDAFEAMAVVSSESMQHQIFVEVVRTITVMFCRLPEDWRNRAEDLVLRILTVLGDHALTAELDSTLSALASTLEASGSTSTVAAVRDAHLSLSRTVGKLNSRSTRAGG